MTMPCPPRRLAIDIGGTFTDLVLEHGASRDRGQGSDHAAASRNAASWMACAWCWTARGLRPADIGAVMHGTTLATNAIIERKGARTALVTTEGFRDSVEMAYENRFDQYDIFIDKPEPLVPRYLRFGVPERMDVHGNVRIPLDTDAVARTGRYADGARASRAWPSGSCTATPIPRTSSGRRDAGGGAARRLHHAVVARSVPRCGNTSGSRPPAPTPMCSRAWRATSRGCASGSPRSGWLVR